MTRFYLMRHGQTLFNLRKKIQGSCDSPLTDEGIRQAKIAKKYFENNDFSIENMEKIMKNSSKKVIFEKMNLEKNIENLERIESESLYSQLNIMIDKDNIIVGNSGKTAFILYRGNKIFGKISGEKIKNIKLEKNDYLLAGSPEFWEVIDENELTEIHIDKKSKENIEKNLSEKVKIQLLNLGHNKSVFNARVLHVNQNKLNHWTLGLIHQKYGDNGIEMLSDILCKKEEWNNMYTVFSYMMLIRSFRI